MAKKIKKRTKRKDEEEVLLEEQEQSQEPRLEDYVDVNDPAMEFGDPTTWENAGEDDIEVAPIPVDEEGEIDEEALYELTATDQAEMAQARVLDWFDKNIRLVAGLLVVAAVAPIIYVVAMELKQKSDESTSAVVSKAFSMYAKPVEGSPTAKFFETQKDYKKPAMYDSQDAKWNAISKEASQAAGQSSGGAQMTAKMVEAAAAMRIKKFDDAIKIYGEIKTNAPSEPLKTIATLGLAQAHTAKGDAAKAGEAYDTLAKTNKEYEPFAIYYKARSLEMGGKKAEAKKLYNSLLENHPTTSYKADVERRLAML